MAIAFENQIQFQSLIGMLKTVSVCARRAHDQYVSIPHRYAENSSRPATYDEECSVSIPHRYAENWIRSLIRRRRNGVSIPHRYAENVSGAAQSAHNNRVFQSLIGMLKTPAGATMPHCVCSVSIPHRYAENG